jgi:hypothetical protein
MFVAMVDGSATQLEMRSVDVETSFTRCPDAATDRAIWLPCQLRVGPGCLGRAALRKPGTEDAS